MKKINWAETTNDWRPSGGATKVDQEARITMVANFCKYVAENCWDSIEYFEANPLDSKKKLDDDKQSKNSVFELAAKQLLQHKMLWEVKQHKHPDRLSYEFPLAIEIDNKLRYMKFQIAEGVKGLTAPNTVKKVWLRYHVSSLNVEVIYEEE